MHTYATSTEFLSVAEQSALIAIAQDVPAHVETDEYGTERLIYGVTAASEAALDRLTSSFMPLISKAARASKVLDAGDALSVALVEFVEAIRDFDTTSRLPFSAHIGTRLRFAVLRADRANDLVVVKDNVAAVYWRLIYKHDGDFVAAYEETKTTDNNLAASTFLAVHNVIGGIASIEPIISDEDSENPNAFAMAASVGSHEADVLRREEAAWLLSLDDVTAEQRAIVRLAYGFDAIPYEVAEETATEIARSRDEGVAVVKDGALARHLGLSRPKVQRERTKALSTMRAAKETADASVWA